MLALRLLVLVLLPVLLPVLVLLLVLVLPLDPMEPKILMMVPAKYMFELLPPFVLTEPLILIAWATAYTAPAVILLLILITPLLAIKLKLVKGLLE